MNRFSKKLLLVIFSFSVIFHSASAIEYSARIDTEARAQWGDNASDYDLYQTQGLTLFFTPVFSLHYTALLSYDLDGTTSQLLPGFLDQSDAAFRGYEDVIKPDQPFHWRLFEAYAAYSHPKFKASLGRQYLFDFQGAMFDGILFELTPWRWIKLQAFGGIPFHQNFYNYDPLREQTFGANLKLQAPGHNLSGKAGYRFLREKTQISLVPVGGKIDNAFAIIDTHHLHADLYYQPFAWLGGAISFSGLIRNGFEPLLAEAFLFGYFKEIALDYKASYSNQLISLSDLSDRLRAYSTLLGASSPYQIFNLFLYKSFPELAGPKSVLQDIQLELGFQRRFLSNLADANQFNPEYYMGRAGLIVALQENWLFHIYYETYLGDPVQNNTDTIGGEITKKWKLFDLSAGLGYYKYLYQTDFSGTIVSDQFDAREAFLRMNWRLGEFVTLKLQGSYTWASLSSLTQYTIDDTAVTPLITRNREYYALKLGVNVRL